MPADDVSKMPAWHCTDIDEKNRAEHWQPIWRIVSGRVELAEPGVDDKKGEDNGRDPIHGRQNKHSCGDSEEPFS
jgi:hypothetical protein